MHARKLEQQDLNSTPRSSFPNNAINNLNFKMVLLTMTSTMVEALDKIRGLNQATDKNTEKNVFCDDYNSTKGNDDNRGSEDQTKEHTTTDADEKKTIVTALPGHDAHPEERREGNAASEPTLSNPRIGNPISHGQVVDLSQKMKAQKLQPCSLEDLLKGARIYLPPPAPKPELVRIHPWPDEEADIVG